MKHPIKLNWASVLEEDDYVVGGIEVTSSQMDDPFRALSTQQTTEYLNKFDEGDAFNFPPITNDMLTQVDCLIDAAIDTSTSSESATVTATATSTIVTAVSTTATISRFASPRQKDIDSIERSSIPQKTRCSTDWAVKVWTDWAESRNKRLLPRENALCTSINDLILILYFWWNQ